MAEQGVLFSTSNQLPKLTKELSVIVPFVNEHPQAAFTVQAIYCELRDKVDFEIIVIDNWCQEVASQGRQQDDGSKYLQDLSTKRPWLRYMHYDRKLSHWQAKNMGVRSSAGKVLWFCDAHCIPSQGTVVDMLRAYQSRHEELNGTLHLPLSYMLENPGLELTYKLVTDMDRAVVHYSFTRYRRELDIYPVSCMSTCGMMMTRDLYELLGGWPEELGIYGGGENFINFTLAVLGKTVNIFPTRPLFHYAAKRGYHWNYDDYHRNRTIASFMYGGAAFAKKYIEHVKGRPLVLERIYTDVVTKCRPQRDHLEPNIRMSIEEWVARQPKG